MRHFGRRRVVESMVGGLVIAVLVFTAVFAFHWFTADKPAMSYRSLDYEATVQPNGDLKVTQHIDVKLAKRDEGRPWKQLIQRYELNDYNLSDITGISVRNATTGDTYTQLKEPVLPTYIGDATWDRLYANHWYIADVSDGDSELTPYTPGADGIPIYSDPRKYSEYEKNEDTDWATGKTLEIGWNIPSTVKTNSMRFDVTMTLVGAVTRYADVATFQWEPISDSNTVPIGTVTGVVRFPEGAAGTASPGSDSTGTASPGSASADASNPSADDPTTNGPWTWLHYEGASETSRNADGSLRFTAHNVRAGRYLDVVAAYNADAARDTSHGEAGTQYKPAGDWIRQQDWERLPSLIRDERDKEHDWRVSQRRTVSVWGAAAAVGAVLALIALGVAILLLRRATRPHDGGERLEDAAYVRTPPDIGPESVARIANIISIPDEGGTLESRRMAATVLSLASKKAIAIHPGPAELYDGLDLRGDGGAPASRRDVAAALASHDPDRLAKQVASTSTIVIMPVCATNRGSLHLSRPENSLLRLLEAIAEKRRSAVFDLDQMRDTCRTWRGGKNMLDVYTNACDKAFDRLQATKNVGPMPTILAVAAGLYGIVIAGAAMWQGNLALAALIGLPVMAAAGCALLLAPDETLTPDGWKHGREIVGLYRYLEDFSDFTDRGAADLVLWDRYLVYATAMGISRKAMRELAKAYPQMRDPDWLDENGADSMMYWNYRANALHDVLSDTSAFGSGASGGSGAGGSIGPMPGGLAANFGGIGTQLGSGFAEIGSAINSAAPSSSGGGSGGSGGGGGFGGGGGGSGGGSFGGR
ncbi:DUF2207 domain-containing protein [Bifidobacterium platyrrhinorum]|uniref:DUF2207 domain-containing protein n=1 Tax=Bifidobacterium platyrrhinorum TaxID=2661628 RepID=UPI0013D7CC2A|nr:DUF2207 domain-containing protein [Bifidobacterium platyrrhinorum]